MTRDAILRDIDRLEQNLRVIQMPPAITGQLDRYTRELATARTKLRRMDDSAASGDPSHSFRVRASCGHVDVRQMRESVAGVAFDSAAEWQLDAPNGRRCAACRTASPRGDSS